MRRCQGYGVAVRTPAPVAFLGGKIKAFGFPPVFLGPVRPRPALHFFLDAPRAHGNTGPPTPDHPTRITETAMPTTAAVHAWIDAHAVLFSLAFFVVVALWWRLERAADRARQPARTARPVPVETQAQPAPSVLRDPYAGE